jgi:hypothetical protein
MCWPHSQLSSFLMIVFGTTVPLHTTTVVVPSPSSFVLFISVFSFHTYLLQRASTSLLEDFFNSCSSACCFDNFRGSFPTSSFNDFSVFILQWLLDVEIFEAGGSWWGLFSFEFVYFFLIHKWILVILLKMRCQTRQRMPDMSCTTKYVLRLWNPEAFNKDFILFIVLTFE